VRAAHVLLANEPPHIEDRTGAYRRRISAFRLERALTREEVDPGYLAKVADEVPGIVNLLARSAGDALRRGHFLPPTEQDQLMAELRRERDVVTQAIGEGVERKPGARLTNQELFDFVRAYAAAKGIDLGHVHLVSLGRRVAKAMREQHRVEPSRTKAHGGVPFYEGVSLKPPRPIETPIVI
jgi:phage/plasmid-associated DNA primase